MLNKAPSHSKTTIAQGKAKDRTFAKLLRPSGHNNQLYTATRTQRLKPQWTRHRLPRTAFKRASALAARSPKSFVLYLLSRNTSHSLHSFLCLDHDSS